MYHVDVAKLNGKIAERDTTKNALAKAVGIARSTLFRRLRSSTLRICDIHAICKFLRLSAKEAQEIFLAE